MDQSEAAVEGLCELAAASYNDAAEHLYHALVYGAELTARQHERRKEAWARVRPHVATLIVAVNPSDAEITIDGRSIGAGRTSHILFLPPGDHRIRAHLPDYADAEQSTTIPRGEIAKVSLRLSQRFPPPPAPSPRIEEQDPSSGLIGLRPGVEWHIGERFALRAYGELTATLGRPSVWLDGDQYLAAPPVSALVGVGFFIPWRLGREAPRASAARGLVLQGM